MGRTGFEEPQRSISQSVVQLALKTKSAIVSQSEDDYRTMKILDEERFIKGVESLVDPKEVSTLHFIQTFRKMLPQALFKKMLLRTSKKTPLMGFVIEPYSLFLFFKLKDIERAQSLLPERYELKKSRIFADEEPGHYFGMGNLYTRASTFWGVRQEMYLIAEDKESGLLSWIFLDILSNTIISIPSEGIADPNTERAVITTNSRGDIFLDIKEAKSDREFVLKGNISDGKMRKLDQPIWVMGNTSIGHCKHLTDRNEHPFAVIFNPAEVEQALDIPIKDINISTNTLFPGLAEEEPCKVLCFPFAQHYIADSPGRQTKMKDENELISNYNNLGDPGTIRTFSANTIKNLLFVGIGISSVLALLFIIFLSLKMY